MEDIRPWNDSPGLRLGYDKLLDIANSHKTLRLMLGHSGFCDNYEYKLQTLKDNVSRFTLDILDEINKVAVDYGHKFFFVNSKNEGLKVSCDSFVTETDVHFPTDINLLLDSLRKVITLIMSLCIDLSITEWRQGKFNFKKIKP